MAAHIDSRQERYADKYKISVATATAILHEQDARAQRAYIEGAATQASEIAGVLITRCKNREARDWGFAFALGWAHRMNGVRNMSHAANILNCTVALLSHYKRLWDGLLPPKIRVYGKSARACNAYLQARLISYGYRTRTNNDNGR
jgi:hypothetical protein